MVASVLNARTQGLAVLIGSATVLGLRFVGALALSVAITDLLGERALDWLGIGQAMRATNQVLRYGLGR